MTRRQLDLLIEYINLKARIAAREVAHQPAAACNYDRLVEIIAELEESVE